jgi:hypothetical protein
LHSLLLAGLPGAPKSSFFGQGQIRAVKGMVNPKVKGKVNPAVKGRVKAQKPEARS